MSPPVNLCSLNGGRSDMQKSHLFRHRKVQVNLLVIGTQVNNFRAPQNNQDNSIKVNW